MIKVTKTVTRSVTLDVDDAVTLLTGTEGWQFDGAADMLLSKSESELADLLEHESPWDLLEQVDGAGASSITWLFEGGAE